MDKAGRNTTNNVRKTRRFSAPPPVSDREYFRIVAFDGASITGGMGWMSIGVFRDNLHRHLQLSTRTREALSTKNKMTGAALKKRTRRTSPPPVLHQFAQKHFADFYLHKGRIKRQQSSTGTIDFLTDLKELPESSELDSDLHLLMLWIRFQHQHSEPITTDLPASPIVTELATMQAAFDAFKGGEPYQAKLLDDVKAIVNQPRIEWREMAAQKDRAVSIHRVAEALESGFESLIKLLVDQPKIFLTLRWVTGYKMTDFFKTYVNEAYCALTRWIESGIADTPLFGKYQMLDLLAGTSSGGLNALILAKYQSMNEGINQALQMWTALTDVNPQSKHNPFSKRSVEAALGRCSFLGKDSQEVYESHFGNGQTLADLERQVAITTVQLDTGPVNLRRRPALRRWKPTVYHNMTTAFRKGIQRAAFNRNSQKEKTPQRGDYEAAVDQQFSGIRTFPGQEQTPPEKIKLIDVARYTSNVPILSNVFRGPNLYPKPEDIDQDHFHFKFDHPAHSGFLDGGFYANNPSMAAITTALSRGISPESIVLISMGNGRQGEGYAELTEEDLGYNSWLLKSGREGLLIDLILDVGIDAINAYCATLLGPAHIEGEFTGGRYLRNDIWTDTLFMRNLLNAQGRDSLEFKLDEALGVQRYIYTRAELFHHFFNQYWSSQST